MKKTRSPLRKTKSWDKQIKVIEREGMTRTVMGIHRAIDYLSLQFYELQEDMSRKYFEIKEKQKELENFHFKLTQSMIGRKKK